MTDKRTTTEQARIGGKANLAKHGREYYRELARKSVAARRRNKLITPEAMSAVGKANLEKHGTQFYRDIAQKSVAVRREKKMLSSDKMRELVKKRTIRPVKRNLVKRIFGLD